MLILQVDSKCQISASKVSFILMFGEFFLQKIILGKNLFVQKKFDRKFFLQFLGKLFFSKKNFWQKFSFSRFFSIFCKIFILFCGEIFVRQKIFLANFFGNNFIFLAKFLLGKIFFDNFFYKMFANVTVTVGICSRLSQEPTFKVWSKSGQ